MGRLVLAGLLACAGLFAMQQPASAFWKRSQWAACNEAPSQAERVRLNCWQFEPVAPLRAYDRRPPYLPSPYGVAPVTRRLG